MAPWQSGRRLLDSDGASAHVAARLVLYQREAYRLPRSCHGISVLEGEAWVSFSGTDTILRRGEEMRLGPGRDVAIVSPVGLPPLVFEVLSFGGARDGAVLRPRLLGVVRHARPAPPTHR